MKEIYLVKQHSGLIPAMDSDKEIYDQLKLNQTYRVKITKPRNYEFLQKFFVLLKIVYENQSAYNNFEHFRHDLTVECGFYEMKPNYFTGELTPLAKSISFSKMTEFEFKQLFDTFVMKVCELYGYDPETFKEEVKNQTDTVKNNQNKLQ